ncbi:MAG: cupredoxin domain-containing protein [Actinomycetota bacterium]
MKRLLRVGAGAVLAAALAVPVVLLPSPSFASDVTINATEFFFEPSSRSIKPNDRVRWTNTGTNSHNIHFTSGPGVNADVSPGDSTGFVTFPSTGTFRYYCNFNGTPEGQGMAGQIVVTTGSTASPSQPTGSGTRTITISPTPTATRTRRTRSPTATSTATPTTQSPTATPTTFTPTPSPTETLATESPIAIPSFTEDEAGSSGNAQALIAVGVVFALGVIGFLIYRRTLAP